MRRISIAARRRQRNHGTSMSSSMVCRRTSISIRSVGGTSLPFADPRYQQTSGSSTSRFPVSQHQSLAMSTSTLSSVSCYIQDVLRTKRLSPPNPILASLPSAQDVLEGLPPGDQPNLDSLPSFAVLQPHHLQKAAEEISRQHDVELAQLEVRWTSVSEDEGSKSDESPKSLSSLLMDLDRLTAPVVHLREVADLYQTLASTPDKIDDWNKASESVDSQNTKDFVEKLYQSRIVYRALANAISEASDKIPSFLIPFLKRGTHMKSGDADAESMQQFQNELSVLNERLDNVLSYDRASKAMRLQCMSDMYNCIGLTRMHAETLLSGLQMNNTSVWAMAKLQHNHMVESPQTELMESLFPEIASSLKSYLPKQAKLNLDGVGAFLEGKSDVGNTINSGSGDSARASMIAKVEFKQRVRLHGVLKGFMDFCDQILGIVIVEDLDANNGEAGWSKNVRLLHLYEKANGDEGSNKGDYLGTIYFDPFADSYWRTEDAKDLVRTRLFSQRTTGQTSAPVATVALKITPIWDDTPVPMTWKDTRDLLFQLGSAMQLILDQSRQRKNYDGNDWQTIEPSPIDTADFLGHFLEMWLQNDGFVNRLVQLSQEELLLDEETLKILRKDLRYEKALELTNCMFLSALQFAVFEEFDPRGDETLVALQERLATHYLPGSNLPDPSDLSPLLAVFQESGIDQKMSAYGALWSEVLASTVYETFQKTDLRDRVEVERLGSGIRNLFLKGNIGKSLSRNDIADLCKTNDDSIGSGGPLSRVYGFDEKS